MNPLPRILGYLGALPFLLLAAANFLYLDPEGRNVLAFGHVTYGALIASFLGGIHWPFALQRNSQTQIAWSVMPTVIGLALMIVTFSLDALPCLLGMAALFTGMYFADQRLIPHGAFHTEYTVLRRNLTVIVVLSYLAAAGAHFMAAQVPGL